jgi:hypothetical protein
MDLSGLVSWIPVLVVFGIILWVQRRYLRVQLAAQREVLDRQKDNIATLREGVELQRESIRLLGVIASKLDRT